MEQSLGEVLEMTFFDEVIRFLTVFGLFFMGEVLILALWDLVIPKNEDFTYYLIEKA